MIITASCTSITLDSTLLSTSNISVLLKISYQCGTPVEKVIATTATDMPVTLADLDMVDKFSDGVYSFTLEVTNSASTLITETLCYYMECTDGCKFDLVDTTDIKSIEKSLAYLALKLSSSCDSCRCAELCGLYNRLTNTPNTCNACSCQCN